MQFQTGLIGYNHNQIIGAAPGFSSSGSRLVTYTDSEIAPDMVETGQDMTKAAAVLSAGGLVAIPTETVYGLAANGLDEAAVLRIFTAKQRPHFDPLILHIADIAQAQTLCTVMPPAARLLAQRFWPGPLTLLLPKHAAVPDLVTSGLPRVALRVPDHQLAMALLQAVNFPLAAPSANPFGYVSPTRPEHVAAQLGSQVDYILDGGACRVGVESTIIGFESGQAVVHRLGGLSLELLESVAGPLRLALNQNDNPAAPGMISNHYAPLKPLLLGDLEALLAQHGNERSGIIAFRRAPSAAGQHVTVLSPGGDLEEAARQLFAALRHFDAHDVDRILVEPVPDEGLGRAINDRLLRASRRSEAGVAVR